MSVQIIVIGDIHLNNENSSKIEERIEQIVEIVGINSISIEKLIIVCAGDITQSAQKAHFDDFAAMIDLLEESIKGKIKGISIDFLPIPGNHDVDLSSEGERTCKLFLEHERKIETYHDYEDFFNSRLTAYDDFSSHFQHPPFPIGLHHDVYISCKDNKSICFRLFNTAYFSDDFINKGCLKYDVSVVPDIEDLGRHALVVSVSHHAPDWIDNKLRRAFEEKVFNESNVYISAHDHSSAEYIRESKGLRCQIIEAPCLCSKSANDDHGLISAYLEWSDDDKVRWSQIEYKWYDGRYVSMEGRSHEHIINVNHCYRGHRMSPSFINQINALPNEINSLGYHALRINDLFVYPCLSETSAKGVVKRAKSLEKLLRADEDMHYFIFGREKSGKTTVSLKLIQDLWNRGMIPIMVDYNCIRYSKEEEFTSFVNKKYAEYYTLRTHDTYLSLPREQMAFVIDNFNPASKFVEKACAILRGLTSRASVVIVLSDENLQVAFTQNSSYMELASSTFTIYHIDEFNRRKRRELIKKWVGLSSAQDAHIVHEEVLNWEQTFEMLYRDSLLPKFPFYISLFLQVGSKALSDTQDNIGTYGALYELVIMQQLGTLANEEQMQPKELLDFIAEFVYKYYHEKNEPIEFSEQEYEQFVSSYMEHHFVIIDGTPIFTKLRQRGIIKIQNTDGAPSLYRFSHEYYNFYFIARYLNNHIKEESIQLLISRLCSAFHKTDHANIWLFLTHIADTQFIAEVLLHYANSILKEISVIKFDGDANFSLPSKDLTLKIPDMDYESLQGNRLDVADEVEAQGRLLVSSRELDDNEPVAILMQSTRAIQAIGQLLRNYSISMNGEIKVSLLNACYNLTFRSVALVVNLFRSVEDEFVERLIEADKSLTDDAKRKSARREYCNSMCHLLQIYSFAKFSETSTAVAYSRLAPLYDLVRQEAKQSPARHLLNLFIQLYTKKNPTDLQLSDDYQCIRKNGAVPDFMLTVFSV